MASYADRVRETSSTTGTGALTLAGATTGFRSFASAFGADTTVGYCITNGTSWEVGYGVFNTTLSRDRVLASSNAGALVSFTGTLDVFCTLPAATIVDLGIASAMKMNLIRS